MFSKKESAALKMLFWTSFGKSFPKKWILHHTKIKDFAFKFVATTKTAMVCLDLTSNNNEQNNVYFNKLVSLKKILETDFINTIIFDENYILENGKIICRIYTVLPSKFSIHNKNTWNDAFQFFLKNMNQFELFFLAYQDYIKT